MKAIRRWTVSIASSFDRMVSQIENHDALVECAIRDVQQSTARATVQLKRVRKDGQSMRSKLAELHRNAQLWEERAVQVATEDKQRALECLRRRNRIEKELRELEVQAREHSHLEENLTADLQRLKKKLEGLTQQRNLLRTRQSRAEALRVFEDDHSNLFTEVDDIFDRWETKVAEYEFQSGCHDTDIDALDEAFSTQEEEAALLGALDELIATKSQAQ